MEKTADYEAVNKEQELKYYFYQAMQDFDRNQYDEAMALLLHCEAIAPDDAAVNHYLGIMYSALGQESRGFYYHARAYQLCPMEYWYPYALQLFNTGKKQEAIRELEKMSKVLPQESKLYETLQQMYQKMGNMKAALRMQDKLDAINGPSPYGAMQRFQMWAEMGKMKKAKKAITDYLREEPENYYFQVFLGDIAFQGGQMEEAREIYTQVQQQYPENPYLNVSWANYYGVSEQYDSAAYFLLQAIENENTTMEYKFNLLHHWLKRVEGAEEAALKSLVRQYPHSEECLMKLADYYIENQQDSLAEPLLWTAADIDPSSDKVWRSLFTVMSNDTTTTDEQREKLARRAMAARPNQKQWYSLLASIHTNAGRRDSAIYYCREGLKQPDEIDMAYKFMLNVQLAEVYVQDSLLDSAYHYYDAALSIDPENAYVLNNYAYFLAINGGDLRKAEKMSSRCIKKVPDSHTFLDTYAWILHLQGQEMLAKFYMQQAWDKTPEEERQQSDLVEHYIIILGKDPRPQGSKALPQEEKQ